MVVLSLIESISITVNNYSFEDIVMLNLRESKAAFTSNILNLLLEFYQLSLSY